MSWVERGGRLRVDGVDIGISRARLVTETKTRTPNLS